jgi:hypothetical protein
MQSSETQDSRIRTLLSPPNRTVDAGLGVTAETLDLSVDEVLRHKRRKPGNTTGGGLRKAK